MDNQGTRSYPELSQAYFLRSPRLLHGITRRGEEADRTDHALSRGQPAVEETQHRTPHYNARVASRGPEHLFSSGGKVNGGPILAS